MQGRSYEACPSDGYTTRISRIRIFCEYDDDDLPWSMDGADNSGHYTEVLLQYASLADALDALSDFLAVLKQIGIVWEQDRVLGPIRREHRDPQPTS